MAIDRLTTIEAYIEAAPPEGQAHLNRVYAILREVAPDAEAIIKWNQPFFVEPRFLFAFSANKAHLGFTPSEGTMDVFRGELGDYDATKRGILKVPYAKPLPEDLIRRMAEHQRDAVSRRESTSFW